MSKQSVGLAKEMPLYFNAQVSKSSSAVHETSYTLNYCYGGLGKYFICELF
jgi:hypothetical protein